MTYRTFVSSGIVAAALLWPGHALDAADKPKRGLELRASPQVAFSPARIVLTGELKGISSKDEELFCPEVEWDWGDGTQSTASADCGPFEPDTSETKLRYVQQHTFDYPGRFKVVLRLKRGPQLLLAGTTTLTVRAGGNVMYRAAAGRETRLRQPPVPGRSTSDSLLQSP